uniref:Retinoic acid early transcript 1G n=1 Tax=Pipistrellus kuhlii TaxID=59472 RepID=A0A7J7YNW1_PIPKU|nr:retinoic acid early transcript 1G [Pipistrellus kuhlii]
MARTPGPKFILILPPLPVLLVCVCAAPGASGRGDSHSPHYDFNISSDNQPWCMVQGKMDEEKYLFYDCGSNKVISMNLPREEGKAIDSCKGELGTLSNMGNELKPLLADIKREKYADGAPLTLQVRMTCHGNTSGSLEFSLGGQRLLTFHSETEEYKADDSEGERLKKKWEKYEDLSKDFKMTLKGDCKELYKCWVHRKTELETTASLFFFISPGLFLEILQYDLKSAPGKTSLPPSFCTDHSPGPSHNHTYHSLSFTNQDHRWVGDLGHPSHCIGDFLHHDHHLLPLQEKGGKDAAQ